MTTRERIAKGITDHDRAINEARIVALANVREPFRDAMDAFESAKALAKESGRMFSRLAQRREAVRNIGLLDYEAGKKVVERKRQPDNKPLFSGACILTGAVGENADDCTTHEHEP